MEDYEVGLGSQLVCNVIDKKLGLLGHIVIDSTINGHSCGGLRMSPDVSISELQGLARVMTLKFSFLGINEGGAKAGIIANPCMPREAKLALLRTFAEIASPLLKSHAYIPASDMGTNNEEIKTMLESIGLRVPQNNVETGENGEFYVALSVFAGAQAAARYVGSDMAQSTVAIEGFGKVGSSVAKVFSQRGTKVVAISTVKGAIYNPDGLDVPKLIQMKNEIGEDVVNVYEDAKKIGKSELLTLDVEILSPCARHHSINLRNVEKIRANIICAGANIPVTAEAVEVLWRREKLYLPDFVTNCGGILWGSMRHAGLNVNFIENFIIQEIGSKISAIIEASKKSNTSPMRVAEIEAEKKFSRIKAGHNKKTAKSRLFDMALRVYKKNLVPRFLVKLYAPGFFKARLG